MTEGPATRNHTLSCSPEELQELSREILEVRARREVRDIEGRLIGGDFFKVAQHLPENFVDLLILDPPYNLTKDFGGNRFRKRGQHNYAAWFRDVIALLIPVMTKDATLYVCSEWQTSKTILPTLEEHFLLQNRITWEREKGRGAQKNWKNNSEDIWFCTRSKDYCFNVDAVKLKRRVMAPYKVNGQPKDWQAGEDGNYRLTYPSNIWTDITVPFWSMPENTTHPTQKPEKLIAKLMLASSKEGDFVFDPFVGSGTSAVVAAKLGRRWCGIDSNQEYLCWALKRIYAARRDPGIQGYSDGVFWERNTSSQQKSSKGRKATAVQGSIFR